MSIDDATPTEWDIACREARQGAEVKKELKEPTQLLRGISHKTMLEKMRENDIFCSPDRFCRLLQWVQQCAISDAALERMAINAAELGLDYDGPAADTAVIEEGQR